MTFPRVLHLLLSEVQTSEELRLFSSSCASDQSENLTFCEVLEKTSGGVMSALLGRWSEFSAVACFVSLLPAVMSW